MAIYEDSIPFSFSPDGLDETTIDALIEQAYTEDSSPVSPPADLAERRRRRSARRSARRSPSPSPFGDEAA